MPLALPSSTLLSVPPKTGQIAMAAIFMPGSWTSIPYFVLPLTLSGVSSRLAGVPISLKSRTNRLGGDCPFVSEGSI
jgi:hypothetical protein